MQTSNTGNIIQFAGFVVLIANHFHFNLVQTDVEAVLGAGLILYGWIRQYVAHKATVAALSAPHN